MPCALDSNDVHRKQRHSKRRIFERLRGERGYPGGYTADKEAVRERKQQGREVFMPLVGPALPELTSMTERDAGAHVGPGC